MTEDWQHDLTPPAPGDRERTPLTLWLAEYYSGYGRALAGTFGRAAEAIRSLGKIKIDFVLSPAPPIGRPKPVIQEKRPFPHDPPTNRIYPTSFDSWCNEYAQPIKTSQVRHQRTRRTRRR